MGQPKRQEKPAAASAKAEPAAVPDRPFEPWTKPKGLTPRGWAILGAVVLLVQVPLLHRLLRGQAPATLRVPYTDSFDNPASLAANWWTNGGHWRIVDGELLSPGVKNNPLWLKAPLPRDVAVEFDVRSESPEGDIKAEIFGDGYEHASGYVLIHGGWNNSLSIIARLDEHGESFARRRGPFEKDTRTRVEANPYKVEIGRKYRWRIERKGSTLKWSIDGQPFMQFEDPIPLEGAGHDRFGFSSWDANLYFDNLSIQPL